MNITPATTLREVLRIRPFSVEILEELTGISYWHHLDDSVADFCRMKGLDTEILIKRLSLPRIGVEIREWAIEPLYRLIDHLTVNHQAFREKDLPEIGKSLDIQVLPLSPDKHVLEALKHELAMFRVDFLLHLEEEEGFLFPKALRIEACLRHPGISPEIHRGSIDAFPSILLQVPDEKLNYAIANMREMVRHLGNHAPTAIQVGKAMLSLQIFEEKLRMHSGLETEILLPRAKKMEAELTRRTTQELFRFNFGT